MMKMAHRHRHVGKKNKYVEQKELSDSDSEEEIDIHEVVRTGTLLEVKEALATDRPRFIALKDKVSPTICLIPAY